MLRKIVSIFLVMSLMACAAQTENLSNGFEFIEDVESGAEVLESTNERPIQEKNRKLESVENIQPSKLEQLITDEYTITEPVIVPIESFSEMSYLFLVKEATSFNSGGDCWYEYALLGGILDTYEKGRAYYNEINLRYKKTQLVSNYEEIKQSYGESYLHQFYERNITAFSADGERVLLKTYIAPFRTIKVLYEIYEGDQILRPFIYEETSHTIQYNYSKNLQFFTIDVRNYSNILIEEVTKFYKSSYYYMAVGPLIDEPKRTFTMSKTTDKDDTLYYGLMSDENGGLCISIFSISDNELIFQSDSVSPIDKGQYLDKLVPQCVTILDDKLIVGYSSNAIKLENPFFYMDYLDYFEIDIKTNDVKYLCTNGVGIFSPDGKYLAYAPKYNKGEDAEHGYYIYSVETGETAFVPTGKIGRSSSEQPINNIVCWAHKDGLASLLEQ